MQNDIDNTKTLLDNSGGRYSVSKPTAKELDRLGEYESHKSLVAVDSAVKITDNLAKKQMILYGALPFNSDKSSGYDGSQYKIVTLDGLQITEAKNGMLLAGIDVKKLEIPDSETYSLSNKAAGEGIVPAFMNESVQVLTKDNIALSMAHAQQQMKASVVKELDDAAPGVDQREKLRGHFKLQEEMTALKERYRDRKQDDDSHLYEMKMDAYQNGDTFDDHRLVTQMRENAAAYRDKTMLANLMPETMMIVEGKLLTPELSEAYVNNRYAAVDKDWHVPMGDIESQYNFKRTPIMGGDVKGRLYDNGEQVVSAISFVEKGSSGKEDEFLLTVVKDQDDLLWLRAKQSKNMTGGVINEGAAVFEKLGINPKTVLQGVPVASSATSVTERDAMKAQAKEDLMIAQTSPNNVRKMVARAQIEKHHELSNNRLLDPSQPSVLDRRDPNSETLSQAIVSAKYPVIKELAGDELDFFKEHSDDQNRLISESDNIKKAFMVKGSSGDTSMIVLAERTSRHGDGATLKTSDFYVETFDPQGKLRELVHTDLMEIKLDTLDDLDRHSVHSIRRAIEKLPQHSNEDAVKSKVELRGDGTEKDIHPALQKLAAAENSPAAMDVQNAPEPEPARMRMNRP